MLKKREEEDDDDEEEEGYRTGELKKREEEKSKVVFNDIHIFICVKITITAIMLAFAIAQYY